MRGGGRCKFLCYLLVHECMYVAVAVCVCVRELMKKHDLLLLWNFNIAMCYLIFTPKILCGNVSVRKRVQF